MFFYAFGQSTLFHGSDKGLHPNHKPNGASDKDVWIVNFLGLGPIVHASEPKKGGSLTQHESRLTTLSHDLVETTVLPHRDSPLAEVEVK